MNALQAVGDVDAQKKVILLSTHTQKDEITASILEFKSKFNNRIESLTLELSENNIKYSQMLSDNELATNEFNRIISVLQENLSLEKKKLLETKNKTNDQKHTKSVENLNSEIQKCDADIQKFKKENESLQTKITSSTEQLVLTKNEITSMNEEKTKLQTNLTKMLSETATVSASMKTSDDRLVELILGSDLKTSIIKTAVEDEFDSYNSSIDITKIENGAEVISYVTPAPVQKNSKPTEQEISKYKEFVTKIANDKNGNNKLTREQIARIDKYVRQYGANGQTEKDNFEREMAAYNRRKTGGGFFDVSSSEVDISEFSMDELAAHVENLTAELRAL